MHNVGSLFTFHVTSYFDTFSLVRLHFNSAGMSPHRKLRPINHYAAFFFHFYIAYIHTHMLHCTHTHWHGLYNTCTHMPVHTQAHFHNTFTVCSDMQAHTHSNILYRAPCTEVTLIVLTHTVWEHAHTPDLVWLHSNALGLDGCPVCITLGNYMEMEK